ncbi:MAG: hypothetical protein ACLRT4_01230 [Thomasclavelia sp.]
MYINTKSKEAMEQSLCKVLNIDNTELNDLIDDCYKKYQKDKQVLILDNQYDYFFNYVKKHQCKDIDQVLFIHLSRRLDDDNVGYNFKDLITRDTTLSSFMKKYGITFKDDNHIKMMIDNQEVLLEKNNDYSSYYLKDRFGYRFNDYNFKGYMFEDGLENSELYETFEQGPEFFGYLFSFINDDKMIDDFYQQSSYYKFKYLVPLNLIYFEDYNELNDLDKQRHIIVRSLQRLYNYKYDPIMNNMENRIIGIIDNQNLDGEYLVNKVLI